MINEAISMLLSLQQFLVFIPLVSTIFWAHACVVFFFTAIMYAVSQRSLRLSSLHSLALSKRELEFDNLVTNKAKALSLSYQKDLEKEATQKFNTWKSGVEADIAKREKELEAQKAVLQKAKDLETKYNALLGSEWVLLADITGDYDINWKTTFSLLSARVQRAACGEQWQYSASLEILHSGKVVYDLNTGRYVYEKGKRTGYYKLFCGNSTGSACLVKQIDDFIAGFTPDSSEKIKLQTRVWARSMPKR